MVVGQIVLFQAIPYILYKEKDTILPPLVSCIYWLQKSMLVSCAGPIWTSENIIPALKI